MIVRTIRSATKFLALIGCLLLGIQASGEQQRPNILWFVVDDMSANFSCYGEELIKTPHVDALAKEGVRFTRAYATSPVCSTFRSAMITSTAMLLVWAPLHSTQGRTVGYEVRYHPLMFMKDKAHNKEVIMKT